MKIDGTVIPQILKQSDTSVSIEKREERREKMLRSLHARNVMGRLLGQIVRNLCARKIKTRSDLVNFSMKITRVIQ